MARILHQIAVLSLLADVVFFVVAVALGGVEWDFGVAAGPLWDLLCSGTGGMVFVMRGLLWLAG
jgi:hypothetical protein